MADKEGQQFFKQGMGIREILQSVEDALPDSGHDDFVVVTEHGSFRWQTVERARQQADQSDRRDPPSSGISLGEAVSGVA
jgi:hypothetical protein